MALNATSETIRQIVRSGGVERLPSEARKELPAEMRLQDPNYEKLLSLQMMVHVTAMPKTLRPMIEAQIARDEAMAEAVASFLKSPAGRGRKMLVLCGAGHVVYGLGMPARVRRRSPDAKERVVLLSESGELQLSPQDKAQPRGGDHPRAVARNQAAGGRLSVGQASASGTARRPQGVQVAPVEPLKSVAGTRRVPQPMNGTRHVPTTVARPQ